MIAYRELAVEEITRLGEMDRSERVSQAYVQHGAEIELQAVDWDVPTFAPDGPGEHTVPHKIAEWQPVARLGQSWGAFEDERLVGLGVLRHRLAGDMAELAVLHVDRALAARASGGSSPS